MSTTPLPFSASPPAEAHLVARLRARQEAAMTDFYDQYGPLLYHRIRGIVPSPAAAEHVLQESLVRIWLTIDTYEAGHDRLFAWALRICRRVARVHRPEQVPQAASAAESRLEQA